MTIKLTTVLTSFPKHASLGFLCAAVLASAGCSTQRGWVYHANSYPPAAASTGKKVIVTPYVDSRENVNKNMWGLYMIPLMPFGWQKFNAPEGSQMHITSGMWTNYKPTEDYAKALAEDLRGTGLFSDAAFDFGKGDTDYVVTGKIASTKYTGNIISYGLSVYGPLLWFVGFPAGSVRNELSIELSLVDAKSNQAVLTKEYSAAPYKKVTWIYSLANDFQYADMLADVNKQFCEDVRAALQLTSAAGKDVVLTSSEQR